MSSWSFIFWICVCLSLSFPLGETTQDSGRISRDVPWDSDSDLCERISRDVPWDSDSGPVGFGSYSGRNKRSSPVWDFTLRSHKKGRPRTEIPRAKLIFQGISRPSLTDLLGIFPRSILPRSLQLLEKVNQCNFRTYNTIHGVSLELKVRIRVI